MGPILQQLQALPARSRQGLNNLRQRIFQQGERQPKEANLLRTSLSVHRPVWITAGGAQCAGDDHEGLNSRHKEEGQSRPNPSHGAIHTLK
ncbi:Pc12g01940 [Penicillium rubens Wisconsin 54-1255]|uniref:Pc12g01940 protein n=1 Tax=Penicillium rubens (strain ATCC 28089 / DSM 1075 / NRRL 1951 / Wisconsin 54-1255) TaxID=500485 RepID=B6GZD7_PENRW|nr:Pc12g01940 [Penicillium rubens Wisconsin 54-1255]